MHRYFLYNRKRTAAQPGSDNLIQGKDLNEQLLAQGFTQREIHGAIHKIILHQIACKKAYQQLPVTGKIKWHYKKISEQVSGWLKRLTAKGLVLIKTQFAKKPKNPV